jgi:signal transduction histidine kinase
MSMPKVNMIPKFRSLKFRLMFLISIALLLIVGIPVFFFVQQLDENYQEFSTNMIETASQVVYQFIYDGMIKNDSTVIQKNVEMLALDPSISLIRLYRPDGRVLFSSERDEINLNVKSLDRFYFSAAETGEKELFFRDAGGYSHHHLVRVEKECFPCHTNTGQLIAILDVHANFTSSEQIYTTSKNLAIFGGLLIIVILWIFLNLIYQSQIESRLRLMMAGFEKLSSGNFQFKMKMPGKDELFLLAEKFNEMVEKLNLSRQKEDQLFQEKLERADRLVTLGEVAAEIAHEVNNPAGIILTRAEYLKDEMKEKTTSDGYLEDLNIIIQQTEKIADTTRNILHYSRKLPHHFSSTDLNEVIEHSIKILEPRLKKCKVKVNLNSSDQPAIIWGNASQLEQVFCNLINNSLDFIEPKLGEISMEVQEIIAANQKKKFKILYQDNGPGIPQQYWEHIFSPFFTTKDSEKGTGLGLFIARNIISHHKGTIFLEPGHSAGVHFIIELEAFHG